MKDFLLLQSASNAQIWVAHASRVLVSAARRNNLSTKCPPARSGALRKVRESATLSPTREMHALPGNGAHPWFGARRTALCPGETEEAAVPDLLKEDFSLP